jgi:hypothetical protein
VSDDKITLADVRQYLRNGFAVTSAQKEKPRPSVIMQHLSAWDVLPQRADGSAPAV